MRTLKIIRNLVYYDVPQLFIAVDAVDIRYVCLHSECTDDGDLKYIAVQISKDRLNDFIKGHIDLLTVLTKPELENSNFIVTISNEDVTAELFNGDFPADHLPEDGYYYDDSSEENAEILARAIAINRPVIQLAFETPENYHDIDTKCLSAGLVAFQSLVDSSYKKLYKSEDSSASKLRVTTFKAASFDVELYANESLDVFGSSKLSVTFDEINKLFSDKDMEVVDTLRNLKGFAAKNYKRFLDVLLTYGVSVKYKYVFSTVSSEVHGRRVSSNRIKSLQGIMNANSDLGTEEQTFEGRFTAASVDNGKWTFEPDEGKDIKGDANGDLLKGITLTDKHYKIECQALQTINDTTLKEKTKYTLVRIEAVP